MGEGDEEEMVEGLDLKGNFGERLHLSFDLHGGVDLSIWPSDEGSITLNRDQVKVLIEFLRHEG